MAAKLFCLNVLILVVVALVLFCVVDVSNGQNKPLYMSWTKLDNKTDDRPPPKEGHVMTYYDGKLYVYGGFDNGFFMSSNVWEFNLDNGTWRLVFDEKNSDNPPPPRYQPAAALCDDVWYIFGGMTREYETKGIFKGSPIGETERSLDDIIAFNLKKLEWEELKISGSKPPGRWGHSFTQTQEEDQIILFGGYTGDNFSNDLWLFDASSWEWERTSFNVSDIPPLAFHTATFSEREGNSSVLAILGGMNSSYERTADVFLFDLDSESWRVPDTRTDLEPRSDHVAVNMGNSALVYGGKKVGSGSYNNTFLFDLNTTTWTPVYYTNNMEMASLRRGWHAAAVVDSSVYIFGGLDEFWIPLDDLWLLDAGKSSCFPGYYYDSSSKSCQECDEGTYTNTFGNDACKECKQGTYQDKAGRTYCIDCPAGKATDKTGESECEVCDFGGYINKDTGNTECPFEGFVIAVVILTGLCFLWALFLLFVVSIWKADHQVIKASHQAFCVEIICGSFLGFIAVLFLIPFPNKVFCNGFMWAICLCYTMVFGGLFTKTYAIYKVFDNSSSLKKVVYTKTQLFSIVAAMMVIDLIILILWVFIDPMDGEDQGEYTDCRSDTVAFQVIMLVYKGIILLAGVYLAFRTRNLVSTYNESKFIALCIYNVMIGSVVIIGISAVFAGNNDPQSLFGLKALGILFLVTATLTILFVPKLIMIFAGKSEQPKTFKFTSHGTTSSS